MMNVLVLSPGPDTGGQGIRIKRAFDRHSQDIRVREVHNSDSYLRYGRDAEWEEREELYRWAHVVHHKTSLAALRDIRLKRPLVIHWQGSELRNHAERHIQEARQAKARPLISTPDLSVYAPHAEWLPSPFDLEALARYRDPRGTREMSIVHCPTNRSVKGTQALIEAVDRLQERGYRVELDIVEGVSWRACLSRKGRAHVFVDQLVLGYGNNAVEAWAMGIPVIAGAIDPRVTAHMRELFGGELPFFEATEETIEERLAYLLDNPQARAEWAERGLQHARQYHDERVVVERLTRIWQEVRR